MTGNAASRWTTRRVAGWAGVVGIAIPVAGLLVLPIWRFPVTTTAPARVTAFVSDHRAALQAMMLLYTFGIGLWLVFGAGIWARLRGALPADSMIPTCFAAGLIGFVTLLLAGFACFDVVTYRSVDPHVGQALYDLAFGLLAMSGVPTAIALFAYATAVFRHRIMPRRTALIAAATGAAHLALLASFIVASGFFSLEGAVITVVPALLWIWIADTAAALLRIRDHQNR